MIAMLRYQRRLLFVSMILLCSVQASVWGEEIESKMLSKAEEVKDEDGTWESELKTTGFYNELALLASENRVFTASKRVEAIRTAPTAVSVVSSDHLRPLSARYLPQVLRLFPGIDVLQITRTEFTVGIRGFANRGNFRPRDVLVLVDGRTVYDDFSGSVEWETLDIFPQDVGKIEVLRGAASAIHGANAARGVINIITRPPEALPPFESNTSFAGREGFRQRIAAGSSEGLYKWKVTGGYDQAEIWDRFADISLSDDQGARTWRFNTVVAKELSGGAELRLGGGTNRGELLQTTTSGILLRNDQSTDHLRLEYEHPSYSIRSYWNHRKIDSNDPETGEFVSTRTQNLYDLEAVHRVIRFGRSSFSWGGTVRFTEVKADSIGGEEGQVTAGLFLDEQYNVTDRLLLRLAGRLDYHEEAGYQFSPRAGLSYQIHPKHMLKAAVNVGYRNPTLADNFLDLAILEGPDATVFIKGNRDLKPEESIWYEAGYLGRFVPGLTLGLDLFYVVTDRFIRAAFVPPDTLTFVNSDDKVEGGGGELWGQYELTSSLRLIANYGYRKFRENGVENRATAPNQANAGLLYSDRLTGALTVHYRDRAEWPFPSGPDFSPVQEAYYTLNLFLGYQFTKSLGGQIEAYNFTNRKHRELPALGEEIPMELIFTINYRV